MHSDTASSEHILICSSAPETALKTGQYLADTDALLVAATSAADARKYIEIEPVTAVIIDLLLIDSDGISFARELRAEMPWLPIIVMTTDQCEPTFSGDVEQNTCKQTRLQFALKQASINNPATKLEILHLEHSDESAAVIREMLRINTGLFRARSIPEAKIALSIRSYDFALISSNHPLFYQPLEASCRSANDPNAYEPNSLLSIMGQLRQSSERFTTGYCA
ncbi:MAG: response regulator [Gammaproteobacteria bacterium]